MIDDIYSLPLPTAVSTFNVVCVSLSCWLSNDKIRKPHNSVYGEIKMAKMVIFIILVIIFFFLPSGGQLLIVGLAAGYVLRPLIDDIFPPPSHPN